MSSDCTQASLRVLASPFSLEGAELRHVEAGETLHAIFSQLSAAYRADVDHAHVLVAVNQEVVPADRWASFIVPAGAEIVVSPRPQGLDPVTWLYILYAAFVVAAVYYASTLQPPPDPVASPDASPTYSLNAQGNSARLGSPVPARYGRYRIYPDFAATPFREYINSDQYLYQLLAIGQGTYAYEDLKIGDTPIENFADVDFAFYEPGQTVTLFPVGVYGAPEVSGNGITLFAPNDDNYVGISGPFTANPAGTTTRRLAVDVLLSRGLSYANNEGGLDAATVAALFTYRRINDAGVPQGDWAELADVSYTLATVDAQRYTISVEVPQGRYQVRALRVNNTSDDYRLNDEMVWGGLRAYLDGNQSFAHSTLAIKMRATDQLSAQSERKINVVATRKLPIWSVSGWSAATATRNPAWAFCDALRAEYGGRYADSHLDLPGIKALADEWAARGDYFDGQYDTATTLWPALQQICAVGRAVPYQYGEIFSIIRDSGTPQATYLFNGRNIVRDSMTVTYQTMDVWADDSVEIEYIDPSTWKPEYIVCAIPGVDAINPRKVKLFGCTDRTQGHREGMFMAAKMAFRSIVSEFETELDGRVPQYLDGMVVVAENYRWGSGGEVLARTGQLLTLSEPVQFVESVSHYVWLRNDSGRAFGPFEVAAVEGQPVQVTALDALPAWVYTGVDKDRTYFAFARGDQMPRRMLLDNVSPGDGLRMKMRASLDDPRAHQYDAMIDAGTLPTPEPTPPAAAADLSIRSVRIARGGTADAPALLVTWAQVPGALRYFVDVSYDAGASWERVYTGEQPKAQFTVRTGEIVIAIAAMSDVIGPWYETTITAGGGFDVPATPTGLQLVGGVFNTRVLAVEWSTDVTAASWRVDYRDLEGVVRYSQQVQSPKASLDVDTARLNGLKREMDVVLYGVNANGVPSSVPAVIRVKNNQAPTVTGFTATGLLDRVLLEWPFATENDIEGYRVYASKTLNFEPGVANLVATKVPMSMFVFGIEPGEQWYFRIAAYDAWGETDELNFSAQAGAVGELITETDINDDSISTPKLKANSVTASKILVAALSAISANIGDITAGTYTSDPAGFIRGGTTGYMTGNGFWMGYHGGQYKFSLGHSSMPGVHWDGANFYIRGAGGAIVFASGGGGFTVDYSAITGTKPPADATNSLAISNSANLILDNGFHSPGWWRGDQALTAWPVPGKILAVDGVSGEPARNLVITAVSGATGNFDFSSLKWAVSRGRQYRVRLTMYVSVDFNGFISPAIHIPGVAWAVPGATVADPLGAYPAGHTLSSWGAGWSTREGIWTASDAASTFMQTRIAGRVNAGYVYMYMEVIPVAESFQGQGALATANFVDWITQVSGSGKPADNATRNQIYRQGGAAPSSPQTGDLWHVTSAASGYTTGAFYTYFAGFWQLVSDVTAQNIAAGIAGQGSFATLSQITAANASTYIAAAAMGDALIQNLLVDKLIGNTANWVNLNTANASIGTLKIAGNAISAPTGFTASGWISLYSAAYIFTWLPVVNPDPNNWKTAILIFSAAVIPTGSDGSGREHPLILDIIQEGVGTMYSEVVATPVSSLSYDGGGAPRRDDNVCVMIVADIPPGSTRYFHFLATPANGVNGAIAMSRRAAWGMLSAR